MNVLDVALVALAALAVAGGVRLGFVARLLSWIGLGVGFVFGLKALPRFVGWADRTDYMIVVVATVCLVVMTALLGELAGLWLGHRLAPQSPNGVRADRALGGLVGLVGVIALFWLVLPVLAARSGGSTDLVAHSAIARAIDEYLPEPPGVEDALRALIGEDNYPEVFVALQPPVTIEPPEASGLDVTTAERVAASVVRVEGEACSRVVSGTGFVVDASLVVTNAHVVAGQTSTHVERDDSRRLTATVVAFDPARDLALLSVPRLNRPALTLRPAERGDTGGVFGHPEGGPLRIAPFAVARTVQAVGTDIYDTATVRRDVLELAAALRRGDSGSPVVAVDGVVEGVAFAISPDQVDVAYALAPSELEAVMREPHAAPVGTGPCIA